VLKEKSLKIILIISLKLYLIGLLFQLLLIIIIVSLLVVVTTVGLNCELLILKLEEEINFQVVYTAKHV